MTTADAIAAQWRIISHYGCRVTLDSPTGCGVRLTISRPGRAAVGVFTGTLGAVLAAAEGWAKSAAREREK